MGTSGTLNLVKHNSLEHQLCVRERGDARTPFNPVAFDFSIETKFVITRHTQNALNLGFEISYHNFPADRVAHHFISMPLDQVSVLLGHQSIRVTEKHYSPWVKARQEQLEAAVRQTF
jgi:integrase